MYRFRSALSRLPLALAATLLLTLFNWAGTIPAVAASPGLPAPTIAALFSFAGSRPENLGFRAGGFAACPSTPNCVSSLATDPAHAIAPLTFSTAAAAAFEQLKTTVKATPNAAIITASADYLYAEYTSALMGFVDDVEFHLDKAANVIQVRSASRLGESDLGVNRNRIAALQATLN